MTFSAEVFEKQFVTDVYTTISAHFDKTRYHTWPKIRDFIREITPGSLIYDVGCGNGRNMNLRSDCKFIGCDNNRELLSQATRKKLECVYGNNLDLPFEDNSADAIMSIAVIHHFSTQERRVQALRELFRVLKPNGKILIYVWAHEQPRFENHEKHTFVDWNHQQTGTIMNRFYYLFSRNELDKLINDHFDDVIIIESGVQCNNYYNVCVKTK